MIIVGSITLAQQAADSVRRMYPEKTVEIEQGSDHKAGGYADV